MTNTQLRNLGKVDQANLIAFAPVADEGAQVQPNHAQGLLTMPSDITADDTVTIGTNVFQYKALTTDTTATALALNNTDARSLLTLSGAPGVVLAAGDLVRIENEICKIHRVVDLATFKYEIIRARCGTAIATHAGATAVFQAAAVHATNIPVGVNATLTPAVAVPALVEEINNALAGGQRATAKASTIFDPGATYDDGVARPDADRAGKVIAVATVAVDGMLIYSAIPENSVLATTEALTAAGNVWVQGATMLGGLARAIRRIMSFSKVPTAAEVTRDSFVLYVPFTPRAVDVSVRVTATGIPKAWVGGAVYSANQLKVTNEGGTDWATTDTVNVLVFE